MEWVPTWSGEITYGTTTLVSTTWILLEGWEQKQKKMDIATDWQCENKESKNDSSYSHCWAWGCRLFNITSIYWVSPLCQALLLTWWTQQVARQMKQSHFPLDSVRVSRKFRSRRQHTGSPLPGIASPHFLCLENSSSFKTTSNAPTI